VLCFLRRAPGDVLVGPAKIAGSAQRRRRGAILQHGSLLLRRSEAAPEIAGLEDLAGGSLPRHLLAHAWLSGVSDRLGMKWRRRRLSDRQRNRAAALAHDRYATTGWTRHRRP
jgi:lipoate-protein ligase A